MAGEAQPRHAGLTVPLAALVDVSEHVGYPLLALLVGAEASGVPLPGETALIAASLVASKGHLSIEAVIAIAAAAAIIGDNIGYLIGKHFGRRLIERPGPFHDRRLAAMKRGDELFERHGPKAVFFGRWIAGLRIWASWLAGMSTTMRWPQFLLWNALGGIGWAICFGLVGYYGGEAAARLVTRVGVGAAVAAGIVVLVVWLVLRRRLHRDPDASA